MKSALKCGWIVIAVALCCVGCKPDEEVNEAGGVCHEAGDSGWKTCDEESVCLMPEDLRRLGGYDMSGAATAVEGAIEVEEGEDCWGLISDTCVRQGLCVARPQIDEPCVGDEMCGEDLRCVGIRRGDQLNFVCREKKDDDD